MRPTLVDLCCCAGGASVGYWRAGFDVVGVDVAPQPNYPFRFVQGDAVMWLADYVYERRGNVDAFHVSPPCQRWSDLAKRNRNAGAWPDLIDEFRRLLIRSGVPYVIENVPEAPLINPAILCGTQFDGLRVIRHRGFECSFPLGPLRVHGKHPLVFTHDKRKAHYGQLDQDTSFVQVTGGGNATLANKLDAMGIDWMRSHHEVNEAIPPAYTEWIGKQLMEVVNARDFVG